MIAADFIVASDDRIDLSATRQLGQIASIFFERLIFPFRILIRHALRSAHLLQRLHQFVARNAEILERFRRVIFLSGEREQIMLGAGELILELRHLAFGIFERGA